MKKNSVDFNTLIICLVCGFCLSECTSTITAKVESDAAATPLPEKSRLINLVWKPTMKKTDLDLEPLGAYKPITVALVAVIDKRNDVRIIGKAYEDMKVRDVFVPIATKTNVAKWCKSAIEKVFDEFGIKSDEKKGNLLLEIEITEFSIFDDFTQTGTATLRINAHSAEDLLIWEGRINGTSDLYVHATDSDGVSECLSNTIMVTMHNLFTDHSFRDAVIKAFE